MHDLPVTDDVVTAMIQHVDPVATVSRCARISAGWANEVYDVVLSTDRRLVLRVLRTQTSQGAVREHRIQQALHAADVPAPLALELRSGGVVGEVSGHSFTVSERLPGRTGNAAEVSDALIEDFGRTLACFHRATDGVDLDGASEWLNRDVFDCERQKLAVDDARLVEELSVGTDLLFRAGLPLANIHGDLMLGNTFVDGDRIAAIFDFETAEHNVRILDIACSALSLADASDGDLETVAAQVVEGYESVERLTPRERRYLPLALRYVAVACAVMPLLAGETERAERRLGFARSMLARSPAVDQVL